MSGHYDVNRTYGRRRDRRMRDWVCQLNGCPQTYTGFSARAPRCPDHNLPMKPAGTEG